MALSGLLAEFRERRLMRFGLHLRVCDFGLAIGNPCSAAIAMVDCDDLLDVMQLNRRAEIVPKCLVPLLERGRDDADRITNWLNLPVKFCSTVYLCTGSCMRGSMQDKIIAS
jgi:hypothetical protein